MTEDTPPEDLQALVRENRALRAELQAVRNSLRARGSAILAEGLTSPGSAIRLPVHLWSFLKEVRAIKQWRKLVLALECGLPDDPLRRKVPRLGDFPIMRRLTSRVLKGRPAGADLGDGTSSAIKAVIHRCRELEQIAVDGNDLPLADREPLKPQTNRSILMALHACEGDIINGYTRRSQELMSAIKQAGWDVNGAVRGEGGAYRSADGCQYDRIGLVDADSETYEAYVRAYAQRLSAQIEKTRPSLIHAVSNHVTGQAGLLAASRHGLPFVYEVRGLWEETRASVEPSFQNSLGYRAQRRLEIQVAQHADILLVNGMAMAELFKQAGIDSAKIKIVPNGCDAGIRLDEERVQSLRHRWGLSQDPVIGFVGSLTAYEGLDDLLAAISKLGDLRFQLLIVGDGPARSTLEVRALALKVSDKICWAGRVSPEEARLAYALIDIAPIVRSDTLVTRLVPPLKPLDAMVGRAAMILSELPPLVGFAEQGRASLVPAGDVAALRNALVALLTDKTLRDSMTEKAWRWVVANRQWTNSAEVVIRAYEECLHDRL